MRLHQLQTAQARANEGHLPEAWGTGPVLEEALRTRRSDGATVDDLEQVKAALEELRRGGEEERLHRSQLEERVLREIEDLKSFSPCPSSPSLATLERHPTRSQSRQNLLAEERERKRSQANEALHAEVLELNETLAELRVTCADELEAQRLEKRQALSELALAQEQLLQAPSREEALKAELVQAEMELGKARHAVKEQDEALRAFWSLQNAYQHELEEVERQRKQTAFLHEELQAEQSRSLRRSAEADAAGALRAEVANLSGCLRPLEQTIAGFGDWEQTCRQSLKDLPKSFQDEVESLMPDRGHDRGYNSPASLDAEIRQHSEWCSATIRKLSGFAASMLQENARLRQAILEPPASADEAGGRSVNVARRQLNMCLEAFSRGRDEEAAAALAAAEGAKLEDKPKGEARLKAIEMRLTKAEGSMRTGSKQSVPAAKKELSQRIMDEKRTLGVPKVRSAGTPDSSVASESSAAASQASASPPKASASPRSPKPSPRSAEQGKSAAASQGRQRSPRAQGRGSEKCSGTAPVADGRKGAAAIPALETLSLKAEPAERGIPSSCLYNSDSSSGSGSRPRRDAYPPSPENSSPDPPNARWTAQFRPVEGDKPPTPRDGEAPASGAAGGSSIEPAKGSQKTSPRSALQQARQNARAAGVGGRAHGEEKEHDRDSRARAMRYLGGGESAADVFARAEALCEAQRFAEAAELFRCVLAALRTSSERHSLRAVEAEVWAHLGVAMQSLDDIAAAIESYCQAVRLDPSLHVCFANLATLYMYLEDGQKAQEHISKALLLDPSNEAYLEIKRSLSAGTPTA
ncbi:unnamed protein product [Symbiodinium sp. CCMP2592]|nr:unnamed protein product [Symbiodinium sp. CCMP2592]